MDSNIARKTIPSLPLLLGGKKAYDSIIGDNDRAKER
jgi:hypothetical protein